MPRPGIKFPTHPCVIVSDLHHHIAVEIIKIVIKIAARGALYPPPKRIIGVAGCAAAIHLCNAVFGIVGVGVHSVINDVAHGIVGHPIPARYMISHGIKGKLRPLPRRVLVPADSHCGQEFLRRERERWIEPTRPDSIGL